MNTAKINRQSLKPRNGRRDPKISVGKKRSYVRLSLGWSAGGWGRKYSRAEAVEKIDGRACIQRETALEGEDEREQNDKRRERQRDIWGTGGRIGKKNRSARYGAAKDLSAASRLGLK